MGRGVGADRTAVSSLWSTPHVLGTFLVQRACALYLQTWHWCPCLRMPHSSEPQWSQKVGRMYVCALKRCGMSILNRFSIWRGEAACGRR